MLDAYVSTLKALGTVDGYILDWRAFHGCQLISSSYSAALSCPFREGYGGGWRCEVIGPHVKHRWSEHLMAHERYGNGHSCRSVGDSLSGAMKRLNPWSRIGREPWTPDHPFEGDGPHCTAWLESVAGNEEVGILTMRRGCGWSRDTHPQ